MKKWLPVLLVVMAGLVTGCPHNEYIVELTPHGRAIERKLEFYRDDITDTNGATNYETFPPDELAIISALYPKGGITKQGDRHTARGEFLSALPGDVGGFGTYTNLTNSLGHAGFYAERFRGDDDLAALSERSSKAADELTDLLIGFSQYQMGQEPGFGKLRAFLDRDLRRDLKNIGAYMREGQLVAGYNTNAAEEFGARFGQYLLERGYIKTAEIPQLFGYAVQSDEHNAFQWLQRMIASKMGLPESDPVPGSLNFLASSESLDRAFGNFLAGTDQYQIRLKTWAEAKKSNPDLKQPEPTEIISDDFVLLMDFKLFGSTPDHVSVKLSLPTAPLHSNGRWDEAARQMVWNSDIDDRTNAVHFPVFCYASWAEPAEAFQKAHFGKVAVAGDELVQYCLWRTSLDYPKGLEWDTFLMSLKQSDDLPAKLRGFHFSNEVATTGTNTPSAAIRSSDFSSRLIIDGLK